MEKITRAGAPVSRSSRRERKKLAQDKPSPERSVGEVQSRDKKQEIFPARRGDRTYSAKSPRSLTCPDSPSPIHPP
jgi:hypothetical protein